MKFENKIIMILRPGTNMNRPLFLINNRDQSRIKRKEKRARRKVEKKAMIYLGVQFCRRSLSALLQCMPNRSFDIFPRAHVFLSGHSSLFCHALRIPNGLADSPSTHLNQCRKNSNQYASFFNKFTHSYALTNFCILEKYHATDRYNSYIMRNTNFIAYFLPILSSNQMPRDV